MLVLGLVPAFFIALVLVLVLVFLRVLTWGSRDPIYFAFSKYWG